MSNTAEIARAMATTMENAAIPMYGKKLRLPDRSAIIALLKELRRLFFPAYFGDPQLMALPAENYAALLLERIETGMTARSPWLCRTARRLRPPRSPSPSWRSCPASSRCC